MATNNEDVKFCPVIRAQCKDDCTFMEEGVCLFARGLNGLDNIGSAFNEVDPIELSSAVQFLSALNDAPMICTTTGAALSLCSTSESTGACR